MCNKVQFKSQLPLDNWSNRINEGINMMRNIHHKLEVKKSNFRHAKHIGEHHLTWCLFSSCLDLSHRIQTYDATCTCSCAAPCNISSTYSAWVIKVCSIHVFKKVAHQNSTLLLVIQDWVHCWLNLQCLLLYIEEIPIWWKIIKSEKADQLFFFHHFLSGKNIKRRQCHAARG